jgi:hypothetical protein
MDTCDHADIPGAEQHVAAVKHFSQRSQLRARQGGKRTGRLCQVERESTNDASAHVLDDARGCGEHFTTHANAAKHRECGGKMICNCLHS